MTTKMMDLAGVLAFLAGDRNMGPQAAANATWPAHASLGHTTNLELVAALNEKAGLHLPNYVGIDEACALIAGIGHGNLKAAAALRQFAGLA